MDEAILRARILGAIAAGWAVGCRGSDPTPPVEVPIAALPSAAPPAVPVATASGGSGTEPSVTAEQAPDPPTPVASGGAAQACPSGLKRERYCLDPFVPVVSGSKEQPAAASFDKRGCVSSSDVHDSCNGIDAVLSGPDPKAKKCCYEICRGSVKPCGRPLVDATGASRIAPVVAGARDWGVPAIEAAVAPSRALRDAWLADAAMEHASVASFARFALELLAVGAPATFVEDAHRAALDEIAHARVCFALAGAAASMGPGPLDLRGVELRTSLADVAGAAAEEGCCGETFAALAVARAQGGAAEGAVRTALSRIAEDEARHAELAWRFVAWAVATGGADVRDAVQRGFERGIAALRSAPMDDDEGPSDAAWRAAGRLTERDRARVAADACARIIAPSRAALLS